MKGIELLLQFHLEGVAVEDAHWVSNLTPLPSIIVVGVPKRMLPNAAKTGTCAKSTHDFEDVSIDSLKLRVVVSSRIGDLFVGH